VYKDLEKIKDRLDTSEYPKDHPLYSPTNAKVAGTFKDECSGKSCSEFVGLRSKMYSLLLPDSNKMTAKGISKSFVQKQIMHQMYKDCLFQNVRTTAKYENIRSRNHRVATETVNKFALSPFDDKRVLLPGTFDTKAHGHLVTTLWLLERNAGDDYDSNNDD